MPVIEHRAPILPTDADIPKCEDPRVTPFLDQLKAHGVMDDEGKSLVRLNLKRGIFDGNWIWRAEWHNAKLRHGAKATGHEN